MFEVFEITEEEKQMLIAHRKEEARKEKIDDLYADIVEALAQIEKLGGRIVLHSIGGKYVPYHKPIVLSSEVMCEYR
jgi:hypothetical protein